MNGKTLRYGDNSDESFNNSLLIFVLALKSTSDSLSMCPLHPLVFLGKGGFNLFLS